MRTIKYYDEFTNIEFSGNLNEGVLIEITENNDAYSLLSIRLNVFEIDELIKDLKYLRNNQ